VRKEGAQSGGEGWSWGESGTSSGSGSERRRTMASGARARLGRRSPQPWRVLLRPATCALGGERGRGGSGRTEHALKQGRPPADDAKPRGRL